MKLFLDDVRSPPDSSWVLVKTAWECIEILNTGVVREMSLDHDLGNDREFGTGYEVLSWLESQVFGGNLEPPQVMLVHSANPVGRARMLSAIYSIRRMMKSED